MAANPWDSQFSELIVGEQYTSIGRTVTEADVMDYANLTGCWFPIHTDREFASATRFEQPVVQGTYLLGLAEGLLFKNGSSGIRANAGIADVAFKQPVLIGDTVRFRVTVLDKEQASDEDGYVTVLIEGLHSDDSVFVEYENRLLMSNDHEVENTQ